MLLGATLALVSGRVMDEGWMRRGELTHIWYSVHLISWVVVFGSLAIHLLTIARVGGVPLMLSIFQIADRLHDRPSMLIKAFWAGRSKQHRNQSMPRASIVNTICR